MGTTGAERACSSKVIQLNLKLSCDCGFLICQNEYMKAKPETGSPQQAGGVRGQGVTPLSTCYCIGWTSGNCVIGTVLMCWVLTK